MTKNEEQALMAILKTRKWKLNELISLHPNDFWMSNKNGERIVCFEWNNRSFSIAEYGDVFGCSNFLRERFNTQQLFPYKTKTMGNRIKSLTGQTIREYNDSKI